MCYGIIKQHQGWIEVESEVGKGTTVAIYLPALDGIIHVADPPAPRDRWQKGGHETILLVDDETQVREAGRRILESAGYKVLMAVNGQHALDTFVAKHGVIDLVILDLSMPLLSGYEALRSLRLFSPQLPIIISTGRGHEDGKTFLEQTQVEAYLTKPYEVSGLLRVVRQVLDASQSSADGAPSTLSAKR
jgi:DNA-binding response OmpR family regulator